MPRTRISRFTRQRVRWSQQQNWSCFTIRQKESSRLQNRHRQSAAMPIRFGNALISNNEFVVITTVILFSPRIT
jgi:hypothetical protein